MTIQEAREAARNAREKLNTRQATYARARVEGHGVRSAAVMAGYSEGSAQTTGSKLEHNEKVIDYRRALEDLKFAEAGIGEGWIGNRLVEITERCMTAVPVMIWDEVKRKKVESGIYAFDARGAIAALKQLSDRYGGTDKVDKTVSVIFGNEGEELGN